MAQDATVNYATAYEQALQTKYKEAGNFFSQHLWNSPSNNLLRWTGHNEIKMPRLLIKEGRTDRTRRQIGNINANYENQWITYVLQNERHWSTLVDPSDVDETNFVVSIGNITRTFNDVEKIPEMDKQMFSSLFALKEQLDGGNGITSLTLTTENILLEFDRMSTEMSEKQVPMSGRVLYTTPTVATILKSAQGMARNINVNQNNGVIDRVVRVLDETEIREVPSELFMTMYDFSNGAQPVQGAQQIQMMLIHVPCMAAPQKYQFVGLDAPTASSFGNWLYYEQAYDDVILFETRSDGIQFITASTGGGA